MRPVNWSSRTNSDGTTAASEPLSWNAVLGRDAHVGLADQDAVDSADYAAINGHDGADVVASRA
jgi:hypothetical protein